MNFSWLKTFCISCCKMSVSCTGIVLIWLLGMKSGQPSKVSCASISPIKIQVSGLLGKQRIVFVGHKNP
ncbi:hypothetical protein VNO77_24118 [Canavalia gladiata]|uniref:Uncharacterized protein n=1 Tax=Canavalia gladiata TaxID=3824 RepID=A0AAN9L6Y3_CANGL